MTRKIGYVWHLRRLMAERGMFATTGLVPLLAERGVSLSREQVYRLVTRTPERLSLATLAALCDILGCSPGDLVELVAPGADRQGTASRAPGLRPRPGPCGHWSCMIRARTHDSGPGAGLPRRSPARSGQARQGLSGLPQGRRRGPGRGG